MNSCSKLELRYNTTEFSRNFLTLVKATWSTQIFKEQPVLPSLIKQLLSVFTQSFQQRITSNVLNDNNVKGFEELISLYDITHSFSKSMLNVLSNTPSMYFYINIFIIL